MSKKNSQHNDKSEFNRGERQSGGKPELFEYIKNERRLAEPLMINFASLSEAHISANLAPFWFPHVSMDGAITPLENAKKYYLGSFNLMELVTGCYVNERLQFCYPEDPPQDVIFGVAQNGGLVLLYPYDVVYFREPDGSECWARMS